MGFFSSESSTTSEMNQADNRQFADSQAANLQATDDSVATKVDSGGVALVNRSTGGDVYMVHENLNAELAAHSITTVSNNISEALGASLGFADDQVSKLFKLTQDVAHDATMQLEQTRDFAEGLVNQVSETSDQRLSSLSKMAFTGVVALAGLLIWRSF